MIGERLLG